jgi:hypothetical protein
MDEQGVKTVVKAVGYDRNEGHRAMKIKATNLAKGRTETNWFPLLEWQWGRRNASTPSLVTAFRKLANPPASFARP